MWNEAQDSDAVTAKTRAVALEVEENEDSFRDGEDGGGRASGVGSYQDFRDGLIETPIVLPLVRPTIPSIYIEGNPYDFTAETDSCGSLSPESGVFSLSETLDSSRRDSEATTRDGDDRRDSLRSTRSLSVSFGDITDSCGSRTPEYGVFNLSETVDSRRRDSEAKPSDGDDRRDSLRSTRSLSVSFGDVTVCGLLGVGAPKQSVGGDIPTPSRPVLDDLPYINELILSAATPALGPDNSKGRPKALGQLLGALPEWLASRRRHSGASKSSSLDGGDSSLPRSVGGRHGVKAILTQMRGDRLAPGDYHPRVLQPSVSLGAFGDWKDVEHPTLTVSLGFRYFSFPPCCPRSGVH